MRNKNGFTLVETVVAVAVAAIIMAIVGGVLIYSMDSAMKISDATIDKTVGDTALRFVADRIAVADEISIDSSGKVTINDGKVIEIDSESGHLKYGGTEVLDDSFYGDRTIELGFTESSYKTLIVEVSVIRKGSQRYGAKETVELLNTTLN